jgi:hypothetical protein
MINDVDKDGKSANIKKSVFQRELKRTIGQVFFVTFYTKRLLCPCSLIIGLQCTQRKPYPLAHRSLCFHDEFGALKKTCFSLILLRDLKNSFLLARSGFMNTDSVQLRPVCSFYEDLCLIIVAWNSFFSLFLIFYNNVHCFPSILFLAIKNACK